jgi:hypothetical protein
MDEPSAAATPLEDLLVDLDREPRQLIEALRTARERAGGTGADLDEVELEFLERRAADRRLHSLLAAPVGAARLAGLRARLRDLLAAEPGDPAALFDLARVRAELRLGGLAAEADAARRALTERIAAFPDVGQRLRFEAGERWAELATEEEDLPLAQKVAVLEETAAVYGGLAAATGDRGMRKLERRARNAACDRTLQLRLERLLTPTGAAAFENLSLLLLLAVFGLLALEWVRGPARWIEILDASICSFFVLEFLFRLALAPSRRSWFLRNVLTDLLPALPAAAFFFDVGAADATVLARALRFLRVVYVARYLRALRPLFAILRLILFLVRGLDAVFRRFSPLLNRDFVFFERVVVPLARGGGGDDPRTLAFRALRREHVLLEELPPGEVAPLLAARAAALAERQRARIAAPGQAVHARIHPPIGRREIPVEHAISFLWRLTPGELRLWLPRRDVVSLDRLVRIANAPVVRSLPMLRWFRSPERLSTPEERVVDFGRRVALVLEAWRERVLHVADMHGIVTGPQVLDRVASAIVKFSQRPAVRLLLFGGLFTLVRLLVGAQSALGGFLSRFVATPLVVLGGVCLLFLLLGRWLKALAGEAADAFKLTSEAHFIGLVQLVKRRHQDEDLQFLAERVFGGTMPDWEASGHLAAQIHASRTGRLDNLPELHGPGVAEELYRVALLYLHFLDGATLHESDLKTTEQLLANLSLQNIRNAHLGWSKREHRQLRLLSLAEGSLFRGPYVWFRFVTESVAVETAKLVTDYNRNCLTLAQRRAATPEQRDAFVAWRRRRRSVEPGAQERTAPPGERGVFRTTEFNALDFLTIDPQRERHVERVFGRATTRLLRLDRQRMIREIFGTRPLHELPRSRRTLNVYRFYEGRLSRGRVLLAPLYAALGFASAVRFSVQKVVRIVREILATDDGARIRENGRAPFAVALRKIHRMKGPTLVEAMRLRVRFDPRYCGAPEGWSAPAGLEAEPEVERDMDFLGMRERERDELRRQLQQNRRRVEELHALVQRAGFALGVADPVQRARGERAATIAYMTDRDAVRTLLRAEEWFERRLQAAEDRDTVLPAALVRRGFWFVLRGGRRHPVHRWLRSHHAGRRVSRRGRGNLIRAWHAGEPELRAVIEAWGELPPGVRPFDEGLRRLARAHAERDDIARELAALRAVQSLSVLDIGNHRALVFALGGYEADGEDPRQARRMP